MGLFSNNRKGKGSHPFFHKSAKSAHLTTANINQSTTARTTSSVLFVKQYDIMTILREILMPQNQN